MMYDSNNNIEGGVMTRRQQKAFTSSKDSITKHAISRLARVAGVKSLNGLIYEELRLVSVVFLEDVLSKAIAMTEHSRRKILSREDVLEGLRLENYPMYGTGEESSRENCKIYMTPSEKNGTKKTTRAKPGERAIREIKFYQQRFGDCVHIPKLVIERLVKEIGGSHISTLKYEADAIGVLHYALESYLVKLLQDAQLVAIHAKRESVQPKDVQLIRNLRRT